MVFCNHLWHYFFIFFIKTPNFKDFINFNKKQLYFVIFLITFSFLATLVQFEALKVNLVPIFKVFKRATGILLALFFGYFFLKSKLV